MPYSLIPRHADAGTPSASFILDDRPGLPLGAEDVFDALVLDSAFFQSLAQGGTAQALDLVVALDAAAVDQVWRGALGR